VVSENSFSLTYMGNHKLKQDSSGGLLTKF